MSKPRHHLTDQYLIRSVKELAALYGPPGRVARAKQVSRLDDNCKAFIGASPFLVISTSSADGEADASPRGDKPGFVLTPDDHTLLIPDRPGNNRLDSMTNILENGRVGLIFLVPGRPETLRVNGRGEITVDPAVLKRFEVQGKPPRSVLKVTVREVYLHCGKALIRSRLWDPKSQAAAANLPSVGEIVAGHVGSIAPDEVQRIFEQAYRDRLY